MELHVKENMKTQWNARSPAQVYKTIVNENIQMLVIGTLNVTNQLLLVKDTLETHEKHIQMVHLILRTSCSS